MNSLRYLYKLIFSTETQCLISVDRWLQNFVFCNWQERNVCPMAKVRWFLELLYIANIDADYLRRFNNKFCQVWSGTRNINDFPLQRTWHRFQNNEKTTKTFYLDKTFSYHLSNNYSRYTVFLYHILWYNIVLRQWNIYEIPLYNNYLCHT